MRGRKLEPLDDVAGLERMGEMRPAVWFRGTP